MLISIQTLTTLNLRNNGIKSEAVRHLAETLWKNMVSNIVLFFSLCLHTVISIKTLSNLDLRGNGARDDVTLRVFHQINAVRDRIYY